ncbi:MAG: 1-deoxy-D-xylulose-5-phosphate reductoisomerase [Firmicutes bacterium]|jgi:1-deoxy-D-xylulose-5-phosphate reductoisomerase|nr:1-deoxy-D-xylulose-5-phosphate reductoisomerase [Bacillota bacterium]NLL88059.1 1-deoxy-D-xylulose-5-phosphate reductoisomerase [Bacillota bacterium]HKM17345.1 1-deoxy-D-xylulose-5-phosphate reductoisomerase [Limnochordia bacterium]
MINVAILGSTGSIGTQTLQVIQHLTGYRVYGLSAYRDIAGLARQIKNCQPQIVVVSDRDSARQLGNRFNIKTAHGEAGLLELAADPNVDIVVVAVVGFAALAPTLRALQAGKKVALASKEALVAGGHLLAPYRSQIMPIDSEHSALWQILDGKNSETVESAILTASGGPFLYEPKDLSRVTVEQALKHPTWQMGGKITVDSATLMNKGLEIIEAHWLFSLGYDQIDVVIHPQSIVHSMVRFVDGSVLAQMAVADMRLPIQRALTYPKIGKSLVSRLDLASLPELTFMRYNPERFPCLELAVTAGKTGGSMPAALNAANEVAVNSFLEGRVAFTDIAEIVKEVIDKHQLVLDPDLAQLAAADEHARATALSLVEQLGRKG